MDYLAYYNAVNSSHYFPHLDGEATRQTLCFTLDEVTFMQKVANEFRNDFLLKYLEALETSNENSTSENRRSTIIRLAMLKRLRGLQVKLSIAERALREFIPPHIEDFELPHIREAGLSLTHGQIGMALNLTGKWPGPDKDSPIWPLFEKLYRVTFEKDPPQYR